MDKLQKEEVSGFQNSIDYLKNNLIRQITRIKQEGYEYVGKKVINQKHEKVLTEPIEQVEKTYGKFSMIRGVIRNKDKTLTIANDEFDCMY